MGQGHHPVSGYKRGDGAVIGAHQRKSSARRTPEVDPEATDAARDAAAVAQRSASTLLRPVDPAAIADEVGPLLDEEFLPVVVGKISADHDGFAREDKGFSINRAKALAATTGMPDELVEDLSSALDEARTHRSRYDHARKLAQNSEDAVVRDACELFAQRLSDPDCGALASCSEGIESTWARFARSFAERAGPRLLESGAISGPDRYGGYELTIPAESVFAELAPPPR